MLDIRFYERLIDKLTSDLRMAKNLTVWMSKHYSSNTMARYLSVFQSLQDQLIMLENINKDIKHSFSNKKH